MLSEAAPLCTGQIVRQVASDGSRPSSDGVNRTPARAGGHSRRGVIAVV